MPPPPSAASGTDQQEVEWQFDARDLADVQAWLVLRGGGGIDERDPDAPITLPEAVPGAAQSLHDSYLDTADWRLHRAGFVLRIRRTDDRAEATLKSMAAAVDGIRRRREVTEALPAASHDAVAVLGGLPGPVGELVRQLAGTRPLKVLFTLHTLRRPFGMTLDGAPAGEVVLDETRVVDAASIASESAMHESAMHESAMPESTALESIAPDPAKLLHRVEVEVPASLVDRLAPYVGALCEDCVLVPAVRAKFELGLEAAALVPGTLPELGPTRVDPHVTIGQAAYAALRVHLSAMRAAEPGTRLGEDIEALHKMRVATRRMRAAIRLFHAVLPPEIDRLNGELRWVAAALGDVRDRDVQLEQLNAWMAEADPGEAAALDALVRLLAERRKTARTRMLMVLDSSRYDTFVESMTAFVRAGPSAEPTTAHAPVTAYAPGLIRRAYRKARRLGDEIDRSARPDEYHTLRIAMKRLRYAFEFLVGVYGRPARVFIGRTTVLQELLGRHQDADVAIQQLHDLVSSQGAQLPGGTLFAMGQVAERYAEDAARLRRAFPRAYARIRGKAWRRLEARMRKAEARGSAR